MFVTLIVNAQIRPHNDRLSTFINDHKSVNGNSLNALKLIFLFTGFIYKFFRLAFPYLLPKFSRYDHAVMT
jgi:hypothetical protein